MDVSGRSGEMEVFVAVAEHGSLSAAARQLDLTPSAISRIVRASKPGWARACWCAPRGTFH